MARKLASDIQKRWPDAWEAMDNDLKIAIGGVPPSLEKEAFDKIIVEADQTGGRINLWAIIDSLGKTPAETPQPEPEKTAKTNQPEESFINRTKNAIKNFRQNKWVKRVVIGGGIVFGILALMFVFWFLGGTDTQSQPPTTNYTTQPTQQTLQNNSWAIPEPVAKPIDFFNYATPTMVQVITILSIVLIIYFGYKDIVHRNEWDDAKLTIEGFAIIIVLGVLFYLFKDPFLIGYFQFDERQLKVVQVLYGGLLTWAALRTVYIACKQGIRDWTPMGTLLVAVGSMGLFFGTRGLGTIGLFLMIPDAPSYPFITVYGYFWHREYLQIWSSLTIYLTLGTGVWILAKEAYKSILAASNKELWSAITGSILFLVLYPIGRFFISNWSPLAIYAIALGLSAILGGLQPQREEKFGKGSSPLGEGEERIGKAYIPPYDKLSWQISALLLFIALFGTV